MSEIEEAYRILELKVGATYRQVSEARDDLLILWDPRRLTDHPRLRARGARKVQEINQAYEVLMQHLGQGSRQEENSSAVSARAAGTAEARQIRAKPSTSLFDEVFSKRGTPRGRGGRPIPIWAIVGVASAIILAIVLVPAFQSTPVSPPPASTVDPVGGVALDREDDLSGGETPSAETVSGGDGTLLTPQPAQTAEKHDAVTIAEQGRSQGGQTPAPVAPPSIPPEAVKSVPAKKTEARPVSASPTPRLLRGPEEPAAPSPQQEREKDEMAYATLLEKAPAARQLAGGNLSEFRLARWEVVERKPSEVWLDLIATGKDGSDVHFVWSVDLQGGPSRALSTAARELEKRDN